MATLSSSSTLAEVQAAYRDNASYDVDESTTKAGEFITACRMLLLMIPKRAAHGGRGAEEVETDPVVLRAELQEAQRWLRAKRAASAGRVRHFSFENLR
jgi:hypothetical protein